MSGRHRWEAPYAHIEQRELERLRELAEADATRRESDGTGAARVPHHRRKRRQRSWNALVLAIVALRVRAEAGGLTRDGFASLGRWVGTSPDTMRRAVRWLVKAGIVVEAKQPARRHGESRGSAWVWPRTVVPFEQWPAVAQEPRTEQPSSDGLGGTREQHTAPLSAGKSHVLIPEEGGTDTRRAMQTPSDNPDVPQRSPKGSAHAEGDAGYDWDAARRQRAAEFEAARRRRGYASEVDVVSPVRLTNADR